MTLILWQGHEVDAYKITAAGNAEVTNAHEAAYERTGMRAGGSGSGSITSTPDWPATNEIWQRFNSCEGVYTADRIIWAAIKADGTTVARIIGVGFTQAKYQALIGGVLTDVGVAFDLQPANTINRYDIHHNGIAAGRIEVWYGPIGAQTKVVDATANYSAANAIVRIFHGPNLVGGYASDVAHEIVQTTSTLSSTSEIKPPTSNGADVDGTGTWADVDEQVFSDVDLITLGAVGQRQSFKAAARTQSQAVVTGVTASCRAWYEAGGPTQIKPYLTIGAVRYYGTTFALDLTALAFQYTWALNPATGVPFTTAEANAATLEWGWEAVA